jgi:hypothetical protein
MDKFVARLAVLSSSTTQNRASDCTINFDWNGTASGIFEQEVQSFS